MKARQQAREYAGMQRHDADLNALPDSMPPRTLGGMPGGRFKVGAGDRMENGPCLVDWSIGRLVRAV
ncbi:hypothetical protein RGU77_10335 [Actimicrobium sp. CCI2.3]|uniref:hypothetical protein n=1 Tax=Actimicrobium sp. CCI2.3 TaxID=3048616 RepID=UPI002AB52BFC|nr:hypothetical protein [Actimicrobium sp. CCI2.3]MDY7574682.1 hypothetical protein [Actimicrobium sp. CCI2.3]